MVSTCRNVLDLHFHLCHLLLDAQQLRFLNRLLLLEFLDQSDRVFRKQLVPVLVFTIGLFCLFSSFIQITLQLVVFATDVLLIGALPERVRPRDKDFTKVGEVVRVVITAHSLYHLEHVASEIIVRFLIINGHRVTECLKRLVFGAEVGLDLRFIKGNALLD